MDNLTKIICAIFASGGLTTLVQFIVTRIELRRSLAKRLDVLEESFAEHRATLARTHILRFADEQRELAAQSRTHSLEYFRQTLQDIDTYEKYCAKHPDYANSMTEISSAYIKSEFEKVYRI